MVRLSAPKRQDMRVKLSGKITAAYAVAQSNNKLNSHMSFDDRDLELRTDEEEYSEVQPVKHDGD